MENVVIERREITLHVSPKVVYDAFAGLGGKKGWLSLSLVYFQRIVQKNLTEGGSFEAGLKAPFLINLLQGLDSLIKGTKLVLCSVVMTCIS